MIDKTDQRLHLTLRQLEVFVATARAGTVRAGAARVSRSQSAASAAIAELESAVGAALTQPTPNHCQVGSSLVDRVAYAITGDGDGPINWKPEARAAIREVARWIREQQDGDLIAATMLEQEAER